MGVVKINHRGGSKGGAPRRSSVSRPRSEEALHFTLPSDLSAGHDAQRQILSAIERGGYDQQHLFAIRLALEEALVNAIRHGNKLDPAKKVKVDADISARRVEITIEDEGSGFKRAVVPDPRAEGNIDRCCGRGLLLMESYMDRVEYSRGGRRIRMVKKNQTSGQSAVGSQQ